MPCLHECAPHLPKQHLKRLSLQRRLHHKAMKLSLPCSTIFASMQIILIVLCILLNGTQGLDIFGKKTVEISELEDDKVPCTCGVFLDRQISKNMIMPDQEKSPVFSYPIQDEEKIHSGLKGRTICTKKCVELAMKYAQQGPTLLCAALVDLNKQKAHLFIKNHDDKWHNTKLNSGREYCCKDGLPSKCF